MKKIFKIVAAILALALIAGILFIANSFVGNPITSKMADKAIKEYVDKNYSSLNLNVEKAKYEFKDGSYFAMAKSKTSIDKKFPIYYRNGKVQRDEYEFYVLGMFNTMERFSAEYSAEAKKIIAEKLGYAANTTRVDFDKSEYDNIKDKLKLDMKFDKTLPLKAEVSIRLELKDNSPETMAKIFIDANEAFKDSGCNFTTYGLYSQKKNAYVMVDKVTVKDIEGGNLVTLLKEAEKNRSGAGISVLIKN